MRRKAKITVRDIPQKDIEEANRILKLKNFSRRGKKIKISATTGLCHTCREKPAAKLVLFRIPGAYKVERYCLQDFHYSSYEDKKKERVKKK